MFKTWYRVWEKDKNYLSSRTSESLNNVYYIPEDPPMQILPPTTECQTNMGRSFYTARNAIKTAKRNKKHKPLYKESSKDTSPPPPPCTLPFANYKIIESFNPILGTELQGTLKIWAKNQILNFPTMIDNSSLRQSNIPKGQIINIFNNEYNKQIILGWYTKFRQLELRLERLQHLCIS